MTLLNQFPYNHVDLVQAFFFNVGKKTQGWKNSKLKEKTQNSSTKLKVSANLVKKYCRNQGQCFKKWGAKDWNGQYMAKNAINRWKRYILKQISQKSIEISQNSSKKLNISSRKLKNSSKKLKVSANPLGLLAENRSKKKACYNGTTTPSGLYQSEGWINPTVVSFSPRNRGTQPPNQQPEISRPVASRRSVIT